MSDQPAFPLVKVECHAGYRGDETPQRIRLVGRQIEIVEIVERWQTPEHRYFKVKDTRGAIYVLRHDVGVDRWELTG